MFSVVIPLYNKEKSIINTIQSVLNQTFQDFEIVVINDGSTDKSAEIVEHIKDFRIRLVHQENQGVSAARNRGIKEAKYDWVTFLDGDDWWSDDFLTVLNDLQIKYPDAGIWAGQYVQVYDKQKEIIVDRFPPIKEGYFQLYDFLYAVCSSSILLKKNIFKECGYFNTKLTHGEDTDMWIRIGMKYKMCYTNKVISYYNIGGNPLTKSTGKIPNFENHLLSNIDNYIGIDIEWDKIIVKKKADYLLIYYLEYPNNRKIKEMIDTLPDYIYDNRKRYKILKLPVFLIFILHFNKRIIRYICYSKNRIELYLKL